MNRQIDENSRWQAPYGLWENLKVAAREHRKAPTPAEAQMWTLLRGSHMDGVRFRRQHAIGQFIVDFYCASKNLVVEIDGSIHENQVEADAVRQDFLEQKGLRVLRFTNDEVLNDLSKVAVTILEAMATSPQPSPPGGEGA